MKYLSTILLVLILTSCTHIQNKISIEPLKLNEREKILIQKTGVQYIQYFSINGKLAKKEDLVYEVVTYKDGKLQNSGLSMSGEIEKSFKNDILSFGVQDFGTNEKKLKVLLGSPNSVVSTEIPNNMAMWSFSSLIQDQILLQKGKPVYLAAWSGTTKDYMSGPSNVNGEFPSGLEEPEFVLLYKVTLKDEAKQKTTQ